MGAIGVGPTGWPHANVAHADLADADIGALIARLAKLPATRGIRQQLHWHQNPQYTFAPAPDLMNGAARRRGLAMLAGHQFLFELQIFANQMAFGAGLARRAILHDTAARLYRMA